MTETAKVQNPIVTRNEINKALSPQVFGKKSPHSGKTFFSPVVNEKDETQFLSDIKWVGLGDAASMVNTMLRRIFADIYVSNVDEETGILNTEQMEADWQDFTAGVQRLGDIDEKIEGIQDEIGSIIADDAFGEVDGDGVSTPKALELQKRIKELHSEIKPLKVAKAEIEAKYAVRAEKRKAKKAAKAAEAAANGTAVTA